MPSSLKASLYLPRPCTTVVRTLIILFLNLLSASHGPQVVISFTSTAYITVIILIIHYYFNHDPTVDPFIKADDRSAGGSPHKFRSNPVDVVILEFVHRKVIIAAHPTFSDGTDKVSANTICLSWFHKLSNASLVYPCYGRYPDTDRLRYPYLRLRHAS